MICYMNDLMIRVESGDTIFSPEMENYGSMTDYLMDFCHSFEGGKIYGLIGECGSGGWGISSLLCGKESREESRVLMNGVKVSQNELEKWGWYVGEGIARRCHFSREKSVIGQIRHGLNVSKKCDENEIIRRFGLSDKRLDLRLSNLSWERWRASAAIGYAHDCKIFCFPWVNTSYLNDLIMNSRIEVFSDILKQEGNIVIIPTEKEESLEMIADEIIVMKDHRWSIS